ARAEEALFAHAAPRLAIRHAHLVPTRDLRNDLLLGEPLELLAVEIVVLAEDGSLHGVASAARSAGSTRPSTGRPGSIPSRCATVGWMSMARTFSTSRPRAMPLPQA